LRLRRTCAGLTPIASTSTQASASSTSYLFLRMPNTNPTWPLSVYYREREKKITRFVTFATTKHSKWLKAEVSIVETFS
jgi:hypothetical protein